MVIFQAKCLFRAIFLSGYDDELERVAKSLNPKAVEEI
jgi:hypothetical protein